MYSQDFVKLYLRKMGWVFLHSLILRRALSILYFKKKKKNVLLKEGPLAQTNISKVSMRCLGRPFAKAAGGKFK